MSSIDIILIASIVILIISPVIYGITKSENQKKNEEKRQLAEKEALELKIRQTQAEVVKKLEEDRLAKEKKAYESMLKNKKKQEAINNSKRIQKTFAGACLRKKNLTEEEANWVVDKQAEKGILIYFYKCKLCSSFHMTSKANGKADQSIIYI